MAPLLKQRGYPVELGRTDFGDVSFIGLGVDGSPISVGCEVKGLNDIIACLKSARFAGHQLPGLLQSYDQVWLLLVGVWRPRHDGTMEYQVERGKSAGYWRSVELGRRKFMWRDLEAFLLTMQMKGGVRLMRVDDYPTAAMFLGTLYSWWQRGWDDHQSHLQMHDAMRDQLFDRALLVRPGQTQCMFAQLSGIGKDKSAGVVKRFNTMQKAVEASIEDWQTVEYMDKSRKFKRFGKDTATRIYNTLHGSNGERR